jgi:hypothetical protein
VAESTRERVSRAQTRSYWQQHLIGWKESRLSQSEYCREQRLSRKSFTYWKSKLGGQAGAAAGRFVQLCARVSVPATAGVAAPINVIIGGSCRIEVREGVRAETLEVVLQAVRKAL